MGIFDLLDIGDDFDFDIINIFFVFLIGFFVYFLGFYYFYGGDVGKGQSIDWLFLIEFYEEVFNIFQ